MEAAIGNLQRVGAIAPTHEWPTRVNDLAERTMKTIRDEDNLLEYWRFCCFCRAKMIGDPIGEARLIACWAVIDTIKAMAMQDDRSSKS